MLKFSNFYLIEEHEVEALELDDTGDRIPYRLTVHVKNGRSYSVNYMKKQDRDKVADQFAQQIDQAIRDQNRTVEAVYNRLYLMDDRLRRVDKRGLRIWQQLKALLGVEVQE